MKSDYEQGTVSVDPQDSSVEKTGKQSVKRIVMKRRGMLFGQSVAQ